MHRHLPPNINFQPFQYAFSLPGCHFSLVLPTVFFKHDGYLVFLCPVPDSLYLKSKKEGNERQNPHEVAHATMKAA